MDKLPNYRSHFRSIRDEVSAEEWQARVELAACYRLVDYYGMTDLTYNHITVRVPGPEHHILINLYGLLYKEITASSLVKIDLDGIQDRVTGLATRPAVMRTLAAAKGFVYYMTQPIQGLSGPIAGESSAIRAYDMKERKEKTLIENVQNFALSFDNFRAVHMCRLIWRQGEFLGVVFENCDTAAWGRHLTACARSSVRKIIRWHLQRMRI